MKFEFEGKEFYIDGYLATALDSLVYNIKKDWDFIILITGDRMVRVGKSVLAMTIGAYLGAALKNLKLNEKAYSVHQVYFDSTLMITEALEKPKYFINHYDEARESLATTKALQRPQQDIIDFFSECGQLNHIFILVLPDFFGLKEDIAVARSEFLINVYRSEKKKMVDLYHTGEKRPVVKFERGRFQLFNREKKEKLYDKAKTIKRKSYSIVKADFIGRFVDQWPINREDYEKLKKESLKRFKSRHTKENVKILTETKKFLEIAKFHTPRQLEEMSKKLGRHRSYFYHALKSAEEKIKPIEEAEREKKEQEMFIIAPNVSNP